MEVTYTVGGTATAGDDYTAPSGTLTLAVGAASGTIAIATLNDGVLDPGETLAVTLSGASTTAGSAEADTTAASTTILDEGTETVSVAATAASTVTEGGAAAFAVTLSGAVASAVELGWTTADGTGTNPATAGADYTAVTAGTLTFQPAAALTQTITVATLQDYLDEVDETFTVTLAAPAGGLPAGVTLSTAGATGTIEDDDQRGVTLKPAALTVLEGDANGAGYAVVLDSRPTATVTIAITGQAGTDLSLSEDHLIFAPANWDTAQTVTVSADEDPDAVADTVDLSHAASGGDYAGVTAAAVTVTITDNDTASTAITLTLAPADVSEGAGATAVTVTAALDAAARTADTVVSVTVAGATAEADTDFTAVSPFALTITAHQHSGTATFELTPIQDTIAEVDETLAVSGTVTETLTVNDATLTLTDDDEAPTGVTLAVTPQSVAEDAGATALTVTATLAGGTTLPAATTVTLTVSDGSGVAGAVDFTAVADFDAGR